MMKFTTALALLAGLTLAVPFQSLAQESGTTTKSDTSATTKSATAAKKKTAKKASAKEADKKDAVKVVGNANCPITGQPVGSMQAGSHLVYNGYKVGLCCDGCSSKFMSDADNYLKKAQGK